MKKKVFVLIFLSLIIFLIPAFIFAQEQPRVQTQKQDRVQTNINLEDQNQARLNLRERIHILEDSIIQQQERSREQEQVHAIFSDIDQHWAQEPVQAAYFWGLASGYPDRNITGPEGVIMMTRLMNHLQGIDLGETTMEGIDWENLPEWAMPQLKERNALRIMSQTPFYMEPQLNRLQFALMLAKAMGIEEADTNDETVVFLDQDQIPSADLGYIHALRTMGIVVGNNGNFYPEQFVTRGEAVSMLSRILDMLQ